MSLFFVRMGCEKAVTMLKKIITDIIGKKEMASRPCVGTNISIGITTFEERFNSYFIPLLKRIRAYEKEIEIIVAINGEHEREFNEDFRMDILKFLSSTPNVYPIMFPRFRGLAKLWNSIIIHATHDYIVMLNDDVMISDPDFIGIIIKTLQRNNGRSFLINRSWSHFVLSRKEIDQLGYFDERLLGIGEEDGDMTWRYIEMYGSEILSYKMKGFINYSEDSVDTYKPHNIQTHSGTKYSLFNRKFMFTKKYERVSDGIKGIFDQPFKLKDTGTEQYPYEQFYRENKTQL